MRVANYKFVEKIAFTLLDMSIENNFILFVHRASKHGKLIAAALEPSTVIEFKFKTKLVSQSVHFESREHRSHRAAGSRLASLMLPRLYFTRTHPLPPAVNQLKLPRASNLRPTRRAAKTSALPTLRSEGFMTAAHSNPRLWLS